LGAKYFEGGHIPFALAFCEQPQFYINDFRRDADKIWLKYEAIGRGFSNYFDNHEKFKAFPKKVKVISGGWYGEYGRWSPKEKYEGLILCENVKSLKQISLEGKDYSLAVRKPFLAAFKTLTAESEDVGIIEIKCKKIIPQSDYSINYFDVELEKWVPMDEMIKKINS
jgi:hypothetical protein